MPLASSKKCTLLKEISFPVFRVGSKEPIREGTGLFYKSENVTDTGETKVIIKYIDDTGVSGKTLGARRLMLMHIEVPLATISRGIMHIKDLIKISNSSTWFIDNTGKLFQYKKTRTEVLSCAKVVKILPAENSTGAIIVVEGIPTRFKLAYQPESDEIYAGILTFYGGYLLYSLYKEPFRKTTRRV